DVAIGRRRRQGENDFGTLGRNYKTEEPIIINKEIKTSSTGEDDGLELKEFHRMNKKKYRSLPVPALRKSQVMDENQKLFVIDKRRFAVVDPFIPSHHRSHTIDSTRTFTSFFGFDGQSQPQSDKIINDNSTKVKIDKLDFIDESNEESPATILVAKKEILTRHGQFSVHSARLIRGGSVKGYNHNVIKSNNGNKLDLGKNSTHFSVTRFSLQTKKNVLRFSSLIATDSTNSIDYFNEIKPMVFYLNYLDQISIPEPDESTINIKDVSILNSTESPGTCHQFALKSFDNSHNISYDFFDKLRQHLRCGNNSGTHIIRCYGLTQDPVTNNYMLVMQYAQNGDLTNYLTNNNSNITWERRLEILYGVAT
ncbi:21322_t:CDS:2, partial [Gigaspora rosea]